jgi:hypothetical protein
MVQAGRAATFLFKIPLFNRKKATHLERAANVKGFWGFEVLFGGLSRPCSRRNMGTPPRFTLQVRPRICLHASGFSLQSHGRVMEINF